tara:strand:- start:587 stop:970 length:384 start_codon:yes stop_codon:yes gene_type:complete
MEQSSQTVTKAKFSNTASGTVVAHPKTGKTIDFEVSRDKDNKVIYTTNLKAITQQVDRNFPAVLTADKVAKIASSSKKKNQPLLVEDNCDYRLSGEPSSFEENLEEGLPASLQAFYKPIIVRDEISF